MKEVVEIMYMHPWSTFFFFMAIGWSIGVMIRGIRGKE
jgi:hypothetical protein